MRREIVPTSSDLDELERLCGGNVQRDVPLSLFSRWRIGGPASLILQPKTLEQLCAVRRHLHSKGLASVVIGGTSNLLFADEGLHAVGLQIGQGMSAIETGATRVKAQAGSLVPRLARRLQQAGMTGFEHICGIPGTLGGLICMNGGSQRLSIGDNVSSVTTVGVSGELRSWDAKACGFSYRNSVFQTNDEAIAEVEMAFGRANDRSDVRREMLDILSSRRKKFPQKEPNCGSVFKSDPAMYALHGPPGAVIEKLGLKGFRLGDVQISPKHANFIVNLGKGRSVDALTLIHMIRSEALERLGCMLHAEARFVASDGLICSADDVPAAYLSDH